MQEFGIGTIFLPIVFFARYPKAVIHRLKDADFRNSGDYVRTQGGIVRRIVYLSGDFCGKQPFMKGFLLAKFMDYNISNIWSS
jgi:hypothetical protein